MDLHINLIFSYSSIKKKCFGDRAVASQVATKFNLSKDKGYDSIVTKIIMQMCAKIGKSFFLRIKQAMKQIVMSNCLN